MRTSKSLSNPLSKAAAGKAVLSNIPKSLSTTVIEGKAPDLAQEEEEQEEDEVEEDQPRDDEQLEIAEGDHLDNGGDANSRASSAALGNG